MVQDAWMPPCPRSRRPTLHDAFALENQPVSALWFPWCHACLRQYLRNILWYAFLKRIGALIRRQNQVSILGTLHNLRLLQLGEQTVVASDIRFRRLLNVDPRFNGSQTLLRKCRNALRQRCHPFRQLFLVVKSFIYPSNSRGLDSIDAACRQYVFRRSSPSNETDQEL